MVKIKLSDIPIKEIYLGMKVKSLNTGVTGKITAIDSPDREDYTIGIRWDNDNITYCWHFWLDQVIKIEDIEEDE